MKGPNRSICSGDVYFVEHLTRGGYQDRLAKRERIEMWAGRPAVVVSDESEHSVPGGGVLVAFITRKAHIPEDPDDHYDDSYYSELSPYQNRIVLGGKPATVLSSRAYWVSKSELGSWMGSVTESDLQRIVSAIRRSGCMTQEGEDLLYQPEGRETGRQSA